MERLEKPIAVLYEHPEWFSGLFDELDRRGLPYERLLAHQLRYDPRDRAARYSVVVNRMSASAFLRDHANATFFAREYLLHLKGCGAWVVNGYEAYLVEISKAAQLEIFERLGVRYPRTLLCNHSGQVAPAAESLKFPVVVKPNIGGRGANIRLFQRPEELREAAETGMLEPGLDSTLLVQEYLPAEGGAITRLEILDGELLYAIRVTPDEDAGFNLCPAEICQIEREQERGVGIGYCVTETQTVTNKRAMQIEVVTPPPEAVETALRIAREGQLDICGIEYLTSDLDGEKYFYDINALSNFIAGAPQLLGFDPHQRFVDYIVKSAERAR